MRKIFEDLRRAVELTQQNGKKGFSLIELLVVIAIIAILAAIAIPQYNKYRANAMLSNVQGYAKDIVQMAMGLATSSGQNPNNNCRYADHILVITYNASDVDLGTGFTSAQTDGKACTATTTNCTLMALGKDNKTVCDAAKLDIPSWVNTVKTGLGMTIYGTEVKITNGAVNVTSQYSIGSGIYIGCVYYPFNDTMADAGSNYVCRTTP
jgi:prepilin-type N-terminal cleavage/methylation domain-containing protein